MDIVERGMGVPRGHRRRHVTFNFPAFLSIHPPPGRFRPRLGVVEEQRPQEQVDDDEAQQDEPLLLGHHRGRFRG